MDIQLSSSTPIYIMGWYGSCNNESPFPLSTIEDKLFSAYQLNEFGTTLNRYDPNKAAWANHPFETLNSGYSYLLIFNTVDANAADEDKVVTIPGFVSAKHQGMNTSTWPPSPLDPGDGYGRVVGGCEDTSIVSTEIQLSSSTPIYVMGWYGTCDGESPFEISTIEDKLFSAYQLNEFGTTLNRYDPNKAAWANHPFETLNSGYSYLLIFNTVDANAADEDKVVTIPGFVSAKHQGMNTSTWPPSPLDPGDGYGRVSTIDVCTQTELEKLWISFTGNDHYSDWYELETDEVDNFTKFKIATPNYGTDLYNWAKGKVTNLQGILMTASETKPDSTSLTTEQKAKTFASDLLNLKCNDLFNNGHELATNQVNLRVQAYNNQDVPALKKYGSHDNTHNYLGTGKPWEGANMVYRTTTFNSIVTDDSGKNSIDIDYLYFIKNTDENAKIKFSSATPANSTCNGIF